MPLNRSAIAFSLKSSRVIPRYSNNVLFLSTSKNTSTSNSGVRDKEPQNPVHNPYRLKRNPSAKISTPAPPIKSRLSSTASLHRRERKDVPPSFESSPATSRHRRERKEVLSFESHLLSAASRHREERKERMREVKIKDMEIIKSKQGENYRGQAARDQLRNKTTPLNQSSDKQKMEPVVPGSPRTLLDMPISSPALQKSAAFVHRRARLSPLSNPEKKDSSASQDIKSESNVAKATESTTETPSNGQGGILSFVSSLFEGRDKNDTNNPKEKKNRVGREDEK